jgi:hypothetical protein
MPMLLVLVCLDDAVREDTPFQYWYRVEGDAFDPGKTITLGMAFLQPKHLLKTHEMMA